MFKALDAGGGVVARYGLFDLGSGTVDNVTVAQTVKSGVASFLYFYDVPNRKSVIVTFEGEEEGAECKTPHRSAIWPGSQACNCGVVGGAGGEPNTAALQSKRAWRRPPCRRNRIPQAQRPAPRSGDSTTLKLRSGGRQLRGECGGTAGRRSARVGVAHVQRGRAAGECNLLYYICRMGNGGDGTPRGTRRGRKAAGNAAGDGAPRGTRLDGRPSWSSAFPGQVRCACAGSRYSPSPKTG